MKKRGNLEKLFPSVVQFKLDKNDTIKGILITIFISFLICLPFIQTSQSAFNFFHDEGPLIVWSEKLLEGYNPYIDFDYPYLPLTLIINAGLIRLFGSIVLIHLFYACMVVFGAVGVHLLAKRLSKGYSVILVPAVYTLLMFPIFNAPIPAIIANSMMIWSCYFLCSRKNIISGIFAALSLFAKQNVGLPFILAAMIYLLFFYKKESLKSMIKFLTPTIIVCALFFIWAVSLDGLSGVVLNLYIIPASIRHLTNFQWIPTVSSETTWIYFVAQLTLRVLYIIPLFICVYAIFFMRKRSIWTLIALMCLFNLQQFYPPFDLAHFAWAFAPTLILLSYLISSDNRLVSRLSTVLVLGYILLGAYGIHFYQTSPLINNHRLDGQMVNGLYIQPKISEFIDQIEHSLADDSFYVFGSQSTLYLIFDKKVPTETIWFYGPGHDTEQLQKKIILAMEKNVPKKVVIFEDYEPDGYENVKKYINEKYVPVDLVNSPIGDVQILGLKN